VLSTDIEALAAALRDARFDEWRAKGSSQPAAGSLQWRARLLPQQAAACCSILNSSLRHHTFLVSVLHLALSGDGVIADGDQRKDAVAAGQDDVDHFRGASSVSTTSPGSRCRS